MDVGSLQDSVIAIPAVRYLMLPTDKGGSGYKRAVLEDDILQRMKDAITEVVMAYPWDFAIKQTTFNTVVNQASYTLTGLKDDCLVLYYLENTATGKQIISKTIASMNEIRNDNSSIEAGKYWIPDGRDGEFPKAKIVDTPDSVDSITYQYWRNDIDITELAPNFDALLIECLAKRFASSRTAEYDRQLVEIMKNYERPNNKVSVAVLDSQVELNYLKYRTLNGW